MELGERRRRERQDRSLARRRRHLGDPLRHHPQRRQSSSGGWSARPPPRRLLRVSAKSEPALFDVSNATFTIPPASLTLTSPNGGESWTIGSSRTITWTSSNLAGTVELELSRDGGASWSTIVGNTPNDGSQSWVVTGPPTTEALVRVRSVFAAVQDESNAVFTIP